jgi:uncharacterized low-complexity protein
VVEGARPAGRCGTVLRAHQVAALASASGPSGDCGADNARRRHGKLALERPGCKLFHPSLL